MANRLSAIAGRGTVRINNGDRYRTSPTPCPLVIFSLINTKVTQGKQRAKNQRHLQGTSSSDAGGGCDL
ncbi:hypothetical protein [[Phormidium] sp. ETS-05]|uniref:hypothetical protein n=1 Tax=[Phormidium] sp. ETS-05 TaxID=222819 RepID=UPI0018EF0126|nr:hypothetical protein [[Phormidium] sp. ETS-05]